MLQMKNDKAFGKNDLIIVVALLIITFILDVFIREISVKTPYKVIVSLNNEIVDEIMIDRNMTKKYSDDSDEFNIVVIENQTVYIKEANCHNKKCVNHKPISSVGESIICLPHKFIVEIVEK